MNRSNRPSSFTTYLTLYPSKLAVNTITSNLLWLYLVTSICGVEETGLTSGDDFFLVEEIKALLSAVFSKLTRVDLNEEIPGLTSFLDFFSNFVDHFMGVSYGDELFQNFVLMPMQRQQNVEYRRLVWGEKSAALRVLTLRTTPFMSNLLGEREVDDEMLKLYRHALQSGVVRADRQPVLYKIAVHHLDLESRDGKIDQ
ncbi:unnamed protein product [Notodromas monacha]|uniref:RPAP1/MINIYO-like TPR repeats domain-containing protein n=1 Tax=Notodromas monacha TaxID=399045 RepID=A0A7R9BGT4_9CRUS|nr:unnamed protein product [Notodromas monacha]CAG0914364.1 unnamed protein product [Notodromas monacha]